ncbi:MAG: hypothetical protein AB7M12_04080 [Hyphomonadaceae bacterium]
MLNTETLARRNVRIVEHGGRLMEIAEAHLDDVNERHLVVHGVVARALRQASDLDEMTLEFALGVALGIRNETAR